MSSKGEKYKSKASKAKHEKSEGARERAMEYGKKPVKKAAKAAKVSKVMREFKGGTLHSGKGGPVVKSRKQAVAIAMSQAGIKKKAGKK